MKIRRANLEKVVRKEEKPEPRYPGMAYLASVFEGDIAEFTYILRHLVHHRIDYDTFESVDGSIDIFVRENRAKELDAIFKDTKQKVSGVYRKISV